MSPVVDDHRVATPTPVTPVNGQVLMTTPRNKRILPGRRTRRRTRKKIRRRMRRRRRIRRKVKTKIIKTRTRSSNIIPSNTSFQKRKRTSTCIATTAMTMMISTFHRFHLFHLTRSIVTTLCFSRHLYKLILHMHGGATERGPRHSEMCVDGPEWIWPLTFVRIFRLRKVMVVYIGLSRYIAITNLSIIAVFVEYLRQFLIDLNQIYRQSSVPTNTSP